MLTIDDLKNVRRQRLRVISLQERIAALRSRAEYTARQLGECGTDDATRDRLAEYVAELDDLEHHLTSEMITLEHEVQSVDAELTALPENQEIILRLRYCEGKSWRKVAEGAGYCIDWCKQLDGKFRKRTHPN
jgi:DNA-directed RNA polymerase specialized sigma24 family protein